MERGWGVNILEDARHCSVLYICEYFVDAVILGKSRVGISISGISTVRTYIFTNIRVS